MNARVLGIALSLSANAVLAFVVAFRAPHQSLPAETKADALLSTTASAAASASTAEGIEAETWRTLTTGSLADVAARLKAEGFSPRLQRVILSALVRQQFADRHRAIADMIRARPWWKPMLDSGEGSKWIIARQKLLREENDVVDGLIGPDLGSTPYITASRLFRYGNLPPLKLAELDRINSDYGELTSEIRVAAQGIILPEDLEKLRFLEQQNHADIAELLTPEELFEYDLRSSPESWWLRTLTSGMNPSEEEFRALFKARFAFTGLYAGSKYDLMTPEEKQALEKLEPQINEQIKAVLTPDRFAEYQLKSTPEYRATDALAKRLALPPEAAASIVTVQKEITKRAEVIRDNSSLTPFAKNAELGALADEAVARLTPTLGDSGMTAYKQGAGNWLERLRATPAVGTTKG